MGKLNALKTGTYARTNLLPYENAQDFDKLRAEIFADLRPQGSLEREIVDSIVENRWARRRQRQTTAIEMHRQPFGRAVEEFGARSWREAIAVVRRNHVERHRALEDLARAWCQCADLVAMWATKCESDQLEEHAKQIVGMCDSCFKKLSRIEALLDDEREFFAEYSPKKMEKRITNENSRDAQYDKLRARLVIEQEARSLRDKPRGNEDGAGDPAAKQSDDGPEFASREKLT